MGVNSVTVTDPNDLADAIRQAFAQPGPALIDLVVAGKQ
jgi:thiamine pyrophosphate-dependent acetolactate synthase large subunit-like protein